MIPVPTVESATTAGADVRHSERRVALLAWGAVLLAIVFQYCLFRQYAVREITWAHPHSFDGAVYLGNSYSAFDRILNRGLAHGVWDVLTEKTPNGILLPVNNLFFFSLFGADRLTALTANFFYVCLAQILLVYTVRWLTGSWAWATAGLALLMCAGTRYLLVGGLFDTRIDCIAGSLYLISVCLLIRSDRLSSLPFSVAWAAASAILVMFRFIALAYVGILFAAIVIAVLLRYADARVRGSALIGELNARNAAIAAGVFALFVIPALVNNAPVLVQYYGGHFGPEAQMRATEFGISSAVDRVLFYPKWLIRSHLGVSYGICLALLIIGFLIQRGRAVTRADSSGGFAAGSRSWAILVSIAAFAGALLILSADASKSPVVASVLVGPLTILLIATGAYVMRTNIVLKWTAVFAAILALSTQFSFIARRAEFSGPYRRDEIALVETYRKMADYASRAGWQSPSLAVDRIADYLHPYVLSDLAYEASGAWLPIRFVLGSTFNAVPESEALQALDGADFAMITEGSPAGESVFPFDQAMRPLKDKLLAHAATRMLLLDQVSYHGHRFNVYARPRVTVSGVSGDWLTADGATFEMPCQALSGKRTFFVEGSTVQSEFLKNQLGVSASLVVDGVEHPLPQVTVPLTNKYSIPLALPNDIPAQGSCTVSMKFDRYFIPRELGVNSDPRKLVIAYPRSFRFE